MDPKTQADVLKVASRGEIARRLNINLSAVSRWFSRGKIPAERVVALELITGVARERLRPDLYARSTRNRFTVAGEAPCTSSRGPRLRSSRMRANTA